MCFLFNEENYLVIAGKNAQQNEILVRRYLQTHDSLVAFNFFFLRKGAHGYWYVKHNHPCFSLFLSFANSLHAW